MPPKKKVVQATETVEVNETSKYDIVIPKSVSKPGVVKSSTSDSERLQLTNAINNLMTRGDSFVKALEELQEFNKETLTNLDIKIDVKKKEYQDMCISLENDFTNLKIKLQQDLNEFKVVACKEILSGVGMIAVDEKEYDKINNDYQGILSTMEEKISNEIHQEKVKHQDQLNIALNTKDLQHKAETATYKSQIEQQTKEIQVLKDTITNLKQEIAAQRELTKEVAQAGAKGSITQTFGK